MRFNFVLFATILMNGIIMSLSHSLNLLDKTLVKMSPDSMLDYDSRFINQNEDHIRRNFLKKKNQKKKLDFINKVFNDTIHVDGVPHILDKKVNGSRIKKCNKFEKDFLNLLKMKNYNYIYKRDNHWRTWREIDEPDGSKTTICYRCDKNFGKNCTKCHNSGFWTILTTPPPCPFEIFAIIDDGFICAANYSQFNKLNDTCSYTTTYSDLLKSCDNPIKTSWSFTKHYNQPSGSKPSTSVICNDQETCELTTIYAISPQHIVFKIINSSNNIIYSRVMKKGEKNYVCTKDCGSINNNSTTGKPPIDKPYVVDLNTKNKREEKPKKRRKPKVIIFPTNKFVANGLPWEKIKDVDKGNYGIGGLHHYKVEVTTICCNKLLREYTEESEDYVYSDEDF